MGFLFSDKEPWKEAYVELKADPTDHKTQSSFCKEYGVAPSTLYRWLIKDRMAINFEIDKRRKSFVTEIRAKLWKALDKRLDCGSDKGIELGFKLIGDFVERTEQKIDYMRPEDKIARIKELLSQAAEKVEKKSEGE